jgi:hypothetical protein
MQQLGMATPQPCDIIYRYVRSEHGERVLEVQHQGRPFNYWQHGPKQDRSFAKDVEGVLRSAGSFKPHSGMAAGESSGTAPIGRFGLGFKSVFLLTDSPEIHSGAWHFRIKSGCLPEELLPLGDLPEQFTRIRLPLREDVADCQEAGKLLGLLPFLRMTTRLEFKPLNGPFTTMTAKPEVILESDDAIVEQVDLSAPGAVRGNVVKLLRCRSRTHAGQLALLLNSEGIPARWDEVFPQDLYAALPLQARLSCGLAVSHRFEVQSGRTHLVDPKANAGRIAEVTALLECLVKGICAGPATGASLSEVLRRFWGCWQWERGDVECDALRRSLATELVSLAERSPIVPTLDQGRPVSLGSAPHVYFSELPDDFRKALVDAGVTITAGGYKDIPMLPGTIVIDGFATAYRRACDYAGKKVAPGLIAIGWAEIAASFREKAWFALKPDLLNRLAACLNEEQSRKAGEWIALCQILVDRSAENIASLLPCELLPSNFPGKQHLPPRSLDCISASYNEPAVQLLIYAGIKTNPTADDISELAKAQNLTVEDALGILRFLGEKSRFMAYENLGIVFRAPWFPHEGQGISTKAAYHAGRIPDELLGDEVFKAWLGLSDRTEKPAPKPPPPPDPKVVLDKLFEWWEAEGRAWTSRYENRLYPGGRPPGIKTDFDPSDLNDRREWIKLLLLGASHSIGRTRLEQHRNFLDTCDRKDWLSVFADQQSDAQRWMGILEEYLDSPTDEHEYYQWMKQFVSIYQISRWLTHYAEAFLNISRVKQKFALDQIIAIRTSAVFSGSDLDAPALNRALGMGVYFVIRELTRLDILRNDHVHRHCYVPAGRVCALLKVLGCDEVEGASMNERSGVIHKFLIAHLGPERATFGRSFDLPLLALSEDEELQQTFCGRTFAADGDGYSSSQDGRWVTLWDGRKVLIR